MFKIAVYIVTTLALAQQVSIFPLDVVYMILYLFTSYSNIHNSKVVQFQSYGLSKCYTGAQTKGESQLTETACSTDCVKTSYEVNGKVLDTMYCGKYYIYLQW